MAYVQQLIHLEPEQKKAFLKRKKSGSGSISGQLRKAADMYLNSDKLNESEINLARKIKQREVLDILNNQFGEWLEPTNLKIAA